MPPKFLKSKISSLWTEPQAPPAAKRRKRSRDEESVSMGASRDELNSLVAARADKSERANLRDLLVETKRDKKAMNYREMQDKIRRLKELEKEQQERDKELAGGGPAFVQRKSITKKKKKKSLGLGQGVSEGYFADGQLKVSSKTIDKVRHSQKRRTKL